jgi:hypothetical protein
MATIGGSNIVTNGLVLALDAANPKSYVSGSTTWRNLSENNISGSLVNGPTFSSANGGSIVFDGVDDYVVTNTNLTLSNATLLCWIKRNGNQSQYDGILFSRFPSSATGLNFGASNQLGYHWNDTATTYNWNSGLTIPDNTWCMIVVTITPTVGVAYLSQNGLITSSINTTTHNSASSLSFNLFRDPAASRFSSGDISNVQIYNRTLSSQEVLQNYNALKSRYNL